MEIATPISHLFKDALAARQIVEASDCLECRDHSWDSHWPGQKLFHCEKEIVHPWTEDDRSYIKNILQAKPDLEMITFHMASCCSHPKIIDGVFQPSGTIYLRSHLIASAIENIQWLNTVRNDRAIEIAVENNNYYPTPAYEHITDGDFIKEVVESCKIGFLFDVAHAKVTAHNRGVDYKSYVSSLPMDQMVQMHISQHSINPQGMAVDAHISFQESLYPEICDIAGRYKPKYVTIEFYKNTEDLLKIIHRCREVLRYEYT